MAKNITRTLTEFAATFGYALRPPQADDVPMGDVHASPHAQLCEGRVLATNEVSTATLYSVLHEMAHGVSGMNPNEASVHRTFTALLLEYAQIVSPDEDSDD